MKYAEFLQKTSLTKEELIGFAYGRTIEDCPADCTSRLPTPPMLMLDRIVSISRDPANRFIIGERDINVDDWFFNCHFLNDPVQPGCLGVDAVWQLLGFYCIANGALGSGRALGCKEIDFFGQIRPHNKVVRYEVNIRRYLQSPVNATGLVIGSAKVLVDGQHIYDIKDAKVGTFLNIRYENYPFIGPNSIGGTVKEG